MKKVLSVFFLLQGAFLLPGCHYPEAAKIEQKDIRPTIGVNGAPKGAILYVDGLAMGPARNYDGKKRVLRVETGTHRVEVKAADGQVLYAETLFLGDSTARILKIQP